MAIGFSPSQHFSRVRFAVRDFHPDGTGQSPDYKCQNS